MISAAFDLKLNYRLFRNPSTLYSILSLVSFFYPFRARYFSIIGSRSVFADPHQSPIRFKAIVLYAQGVKTRPLVLLDPRKLSVPYRVQLDGLQILWLLANPLRTHGIGESGSKKITGWLLMGAAGTNQIWWFDTNPFTGLLLHPNSYRIIAPAFRTLKDFCLYTAIVSSSIT